MRLEFHPEAELELTTILDYYEEATKGLGEQFMADMLQTSRLLIQFPEIGAPVRTNLRMCSLRRFPFNMIYSARADVLLILSEAHQSCRPGYWKARYQ